jgi:hypothetical protein
MTGAVALRRAGGIRSSTITVGGTPTGKTINQRLLGGLFGFADQGDIPAGVVAAGTPNVHRIDGAINYTPIKAGAVDGTHPTLGHSGSYSYKWATIDAEIDAAATEGAQLYVSLDYCPQLLGGGLPPSTVAPFGTGWYVGPGAEVPSNSASFATMCADLVYHCVVEKGATIPYWGLWNEPDGGFWAGTPAQYFALFAAVSSAVKALGLGVKIGGPELAALDQGTQTTWLTPFLTYCKANAVALDFISFHAYEGTGWSIRRAYALLQGSITAAGWLTALELIVGEWAPTAISNILGFGSAKPFGAAGSTEVLQINDAGAALTAIMLMEMQALGCARGIYFSSKLELPTDQPNSGLVASTGFWAPGNAYRLWAKLLAGNVLPTTLDADPGMHALACSTTSDLTGTIRVLIANHHYSRAQTYPTTVALAVADGRASTLWVIDQAHSNQFDAGLSHAGLETVPCAGTSAGRVILPPLAARSVCLLEIA